MLQLDSKNKLVLFARVRQNMLMNEHLIEQQIHIWRLIVQNPEFFFPFRAKIVTHILREMRHLGIRSTDAYANRELSVDMLCLITSFEIRDEKEKGASATPVTNTPATNTPVTNTPTNIPASNGMTDTTDMTNGIVLPHRAHLLREPRRAARLPPRLPPHGGDPPTHAAPHAPP